MLTLWPPKSLNHDLSEPKLEIMKKELWLFLNQIRFLTIKMKILWKFENKCQF